jgi:hypothetical protein
MDETTAQRVLKSAIDLDKAFGDLDLAISAIPDEDERRRFVRALGDVIGQVNHTIIRPIARQHPKLDPDPL